MFVVIDGVKIAKRGQRLTLDDGRSRHAASEDLGLA